jgi:hypothetical protein
MVSQGEPAMDMSRDFGPGTGSGEPDRLARRDLLILRLEVARRRRRLVQLTANRLRPAQLARLSG